MTCISKQCGIEYVMTRISKKCEMSCWKNQASNVNFVPESFPILAVTKS